MPRGIHDLVERAQQASIQKTLRHSSNRLKLWCD
jgi:hypothetical protein